MGPFKAAPAQETPVEAWPARPDLASGPVPAGERQTTPAPAPTAEGPSSGHPTAVPDFDVEAMAAGASLRHGTQPRIPMDVAVPVRTPSKAPPDLPLRLAFLLLHVDGASALGDVAEATQLPMLEIQAGFLELMALGLVEIAGERAAPGVPRSGERPRAR